ncbi:hypothetical protein MHBO_000059 [Bonamia ostreae]|uniref:Uncharacterized protein n=1 Tax=Bonamia ostreae TaxID=126728 RepID=A0ABV2AE74_9EUKA
MFFTAALSFLFQAGSAVLIFLLIFNQNWAIAETGFAVYRLGLRGYTESTKELNFTESYNYTDPNYFCAGNCDKFSLGNRVILIILSICLVLLLVITTCQVLILCWNLPVKWVLRFINLLLVLSVITTIILYEYMCFRSISLTYSTKRSINYYLGGGLVGALILNGIFSDFV